MKTNDLFEEVTSLTNLFAAFKKASKRKKFRNYVLEYDLNLGFNLIDLRRRLIDGTYKHSGYNKFKVMEPKERIIYAPYFEDLIVQFAIYNVVESIFDRTLIDQVYSCRKGRGIHSCRDYVRSNIRKSKRDNYILKLDIRKFFYSLDRDILKSEIQETIKDKKLVELMFNFTTDYETDKGVPIGNLLSQMFSNVYMRKFDHFVKRELKVKRYCRYVDDILLMDLTKEELPYITEKCIGFLHNLNLEISECRSQTCDQTLNYVGYLTNKKTTKIRKRSYKKFLNAIRPKDFSSDNEASTVNSYIALALKTDSEKLLWRKLRFRFDVEAAQRSNWNRNPS